MNLSIVEQITKSQLRTDLPDFKPGTKSVWMSVFKKVTNPEFRRLKAS